MYKYCDIEGVQFCEIFFVKAAYCMNKNLSDLFSRQLLPLNHIYVVFWKFCVKLRSVECVEKQLEVFFDTELHVIELQSCNAGDLRD